MNNTLVSTLILLWTIIGFFVARKTFNSMNADHYKEVSANEMVFAHLIFGPACWVVLGFIIFGACTKVLKERHKINKLNKILRKTEIYYITLILAGVPKEEVESKMKGSLDLYKSTTGVDLTTVDLKIEAKDNETKI